MFPQTSDNGTAAAPPELQGFRNYSTLICIAIAALSLLLANRILNGLRFKHDATEPPIVPYALPFIGNTLSYGQNVYKFFDVARSLFGPLKPFTCFVALQRFYILNDPYHGQSILRNPGAYSFIAVIVGMFKPLFGVNKDGLDALNSDLSEHGYAYVTARYTRDWIVANTGDGTRLGNLERTYFKHLERLLGELPSTSNSPISLLDLVRNIITEGTVPLLHGDMGMHNEPSFAKDFFTWADNFQTLMTGLPPQIFARKAYLARERCYAAIRRVLNNPERYEQVSDVIKSRLRLAQEHGISVDTAAQIDLGAILALLANSGPAIFWLLVHTYSSPELLQALRTEIAPGITHSSMEQQEGLYTVSVSYLQHRCPLLRSLWDEVLRYYMNSAQMRLVNHDSFIPTSKSSSSSQKLLLRKGALIQIPFRVAHMEPSVWGADAAEFNPKRFMANNQPEEKDARKARQECYRPFGSGLHYCPGRHFAQVEAFTFLATFVGFYEVEFLEGEGVPEARLQGVSLGIAHPDGDVAARIRRRAGLEDARWRYVE